MYRPLDACRSLSFALLPNLICEQTAMLQAGLQHRTPNSIARQDDTSAPLQGPALPLSLCLPAGLSHSLVVPSLMALLFLIWLTAAVSAWQQRFATSRATQSARCPCSAAIFVMLWFFFAKTESESITLWCTCVATARSSSFVLTALQTWQALRQANLLIPLAPAVRRFHSLNRAAAFSGSQPLQVVPGSGFHSLSEACRLWQPHNLPLGDGLCQ